MKQTPPFPQSIQDFLSTPANESRLATKTATATEYKIMMSHINIVQTSE